jgi:hypothetical protein
MTIVLGNFVKLFFENTFCFQVFFFRDFARRKSLPENIIRRISCVPVTPGRSENPDEEQDPYNPPDKIHSPKTMIVPHNCYFKWLKIFFAVNQLLSRFFILHPPKSYGYFSFSTPGNNPTRQR